MGDQETDNLIYGSLADTLQMLSGIINNVPDAAWVPSLAETVGSLDAQAPGCGRMQAFLEQHSNDSLEDLVQCLAVDWTLAFRGMNPGRGPKPPYAGAWMADDGTGVELMLAINSCYAAEGLGSSGSHLNRYDYLGVQLEFLAHLFRKAAAAESEEAQEAALESAASFRNRYILPWLPSYREQVEERCHTDFWKGYLELVEAVLDDIA